MRLKIISAGAAQSVVQQVLAAMKAEIGLQSEVSFGAVGAQRQRLLAGEPADVIILTATMIDELIATGHVLAGNRADLGRVGGGVAVRSGTTHPKVASAAELSASLRAAAAIYIPDPAIATAGMQFMRMCERLAISADVQPKLRTFPNGFAAMTELAQRGAAGAMGCTQITEIKWVSGVELVAPLPPALQNLTMYSLGVCTHAGDPAAAREFTERLTGPQAAGMLVAAGFNLE